MAPRGKRSSGASDPEAEAKAEQRRLEKHEKFRTMVVDHNRMKDGNIVGESKGRLTRVREAIASLSKLANKSSYVWTEEDAEAILSVIEQDLADLRERLIPSEKKVSKYSVGKSLFDPHRNDASREAAAEFGIGTNGYSTDGAEQEAAEVTA
jgi:hypothetical protein